MDKNLDFFSKIILNNSIHLLLYISLFIRALNIIKIRKVKKKEGKRNYYLKLKKVKINNLSFCKSGHFGIKNISANTSNKNHNKKNNNNYILINVNNRIER